MTTKVNVTDVKWHRNGISGEGFHVVLFGWVDGKKNRKMVATVFGANEKKPSMRTAVFDRDELAAGNVAFAGGNSWRGDYFAEALNDAITEYEHR